MRWFSKRKEKEERLSAYLTPKWNQWPFDGLGDGQPGDITLDLEALASKGFITPDRPETDLSRDYNFLKRRLLQRLNYFAMSAAHEVGEEKVCPVVLITSGGPAEGKTFNSSNLTLSLATEERLKVLLIDADLAKPSIPGVFGYDEAKPGLYEYLDNPSLDIQDLILRVGGMPISILPAGQATRSPAQMLGSATMAALIDELSNYNYDFIVMDGPPLLATTEATILAPLADEVILVVGTGDATLEQVGTSLDFLKGNEHVSMIINRLYFPERIASSYPYPGAAA